MKKWSLAHICAYLSLAISVTLLVLWCCNVGGFTVVSLDSFVGVIVALLAIVVTLVVGLQIYNGNELNDKIKQLSTLEKKAKEHEIKIEQHFNYLQHLITVDFGLKAYNEGNYLAAFRYYIASLKCSLSLDKPLNVNKLLKDMEQVNKNVKSGSVYELDRIEKIHEYDKSIRDSKIYDTIKSRYEHVYNDFNSKVKEKA